MNVSRGHNRLDQESIDGAFLAFRYQAVSREIDLGVPLGEELVVGFKFLDKLRFERYSGRFGAAFQSVAKLAIGHGVMLIRSPVSF